MRSDELVEAMELLHQYPRLIAERAAKEAVRAERERLLDDLDAKLTELWVRPTTFAISELSLWTLGQRTVHPLSEEVPK
jgi:hypothetical protein